MTRDERIEKICGWINEGLAEVAIHDRIAKELKVRGRDRLKILEDAKKRLANQPDAGPEIPVPPNNGLGKVSEETKAEEATTTEQSEKTEEQKEEAASESTSNASESKTSSETAQESTEQKESKEEASQSEEKKEEGGTATEEQKEPETPAEPPEGACQVWGQGFCDENDDECKACKSQFSAAFESCLLAMHRAKSATQEGAKKREGKKSEPGKFAGQFKGGTIGLYALVKRMVEAGSQKPEIEKEVYNLLRKERTARYEAMGEEEFTKWAKKRAYVKLQELKAKGITIKKAEKAEKAEAA